MDLSSNIGKLAKLQKKTIDLAVSERQMMNTIFILKFNFIYSESSCPFRIDLHSSKDKNNLLN
jgi:hypothetical protein